MFYQHFLRARCGVVAHRATCGEGGGRRRRHVMKTLEDHKRPTGRGDTRTARRLTSTRTSTPTILYHDARTGAVCFKRSLTAQACFYKLEPLSLPIKYKSYPSPDLPLATECFRKGREGTVCVRLSVIWSHLIVCSLFRLRAGTNIPPGFSGQSDASSFESAGPLPCYHDRVRRIARQDTNVSVRRALRTEERLSRPKHRDVEGKTAAEGRAQPRDRR